MDPDCLKSNSIKLRVGIKCFGLFFENEPTMTRNQIFFEKINPKNCLEIQKMIISNKNFKLWEAIKIVLNLSPFELNKMTILFENFENLHLVFSNEICNHLNQENQLDDLHFRKELMKVLVAFELKFKTFYRSLAFMIMIIRDMSTSIMHREYLCFSENHFK